MRAVVQRVSEASVEAGGQTCGAIAGGLLVFLGVDRADDASDVTYLANKLAHLRIFPDKDGRMNRDVLESGGSVLVVSNFTLLGDARKGRRPAFVSAADPDYANELYEQFCAALRTFDLPVATGRFRTTMNVHSVNDGPVTILLDSKRAF